MERDPLAARYKPVKISQLPDRSQAKARLAGFLYVVTIVAGLFAEIGVRSAFRGENMLSIAANGAFYRLGEAADIVMLCAYLGVTTLLYELLEPAGRQLSLLAAAFSITGIAVLAGNGLLYMAPLALIERAQTGGVCIDGCNATVATLLDLHGVVYGISLIFFGIYCMLIGWLIIRSRNLPTAVGIAMVLGGVSHLVTKAAGLLDPNVAFPKLVSILPLIGEATLAIWLLLFGMRTFTRDTAQKGALVA